MVRTSEVDMCVGFDSTENTTTITDKQSVFFFVLFCFVLLVVLLFQF
jgi:hypothetical protein